MTKNTQNKRNNTEAVLCVKEKNNIDNTIDIRYPVKKVDENIGKVTIPSIKVIITDMKDVELTPHLIYTDKYIITRGDIQLISNDIDLKGGLDKTIVENIIFNPDRNKFECMLDLYNLQLLAESERAKIHAIKYYLSDILTNDIKLDKLISHKRDGHNVKVRITMVLFNKVIVPINLVFIVDGFNRLSGIHIEYKNQTYALIDLYKVLLEKTIKG